MRFYGEWHDDWIAENYLRFPSYKAMARAYNETFGTKFSLAAIKNHTRMKLGIEKPRLTHRHYTEEQIEWLKENYPKYGCEKTCEMFNKKFHETRTFSSMKNFGTQYGIQVNEDVAIKNKISKAHQQNSKRAIRKVGDTRMECGRMVMKTEDGWKAVGRAVWEKENGSIPKGYTVTHLDGNTENYNINNLALISEKCMGLLLAYNLRSDISEITETGIKWCEFYMAMPKAVQQQIV